MEQVRTWVLTAGAVVLALLILATLVRAGEDGRKRP